jgi:hypothetical protein
MKTRILTSLIVLMVISLATVAQTIRRVNNNPGVTGIGVYATLQAAHDASTDGDILYVEISSIVYSAITLSKPLTLIGPGSWSDVYNNENGQATEGNTRIEAITLETGSSGSKLISLDVDGVITNKEASDVTIERCAASKLYLATVNADAHTSNIIVHGCYFRQGIVGESSYSPPSGTWTYSGISIQNSVIMGETEMVLDIDNRYFGIIQNNIFFGRFFHIRNFSITNNILVFTASPYSSLGACTTSNNLSTVGTFPAINGNQNDVAMVDIFVIDPNAALSADYTEETRWTLKETSPAKGAGVSGVDCGIFGGPAPYVLGGIAPYPVIHKMSSTGTGSQASPLTVTISTKSNN